MTSDERTQSMEHLIAGIERYCSAGIDGRVLAAILWGAFYGLMKKEVPTLKVRDVVDEQGNIRQDINTGSSSGPIPLVPEARVFFQNHISYLRIKYPAGPDDKMFPGYNNEKTLQRHLSKALSSLNLLDRTKRLFMTARQEGIKKAYVSLAGQVGQAEAEVVTGRQFRISSKEVSDILGDTIRRSTPALASFGLPPEMKIVADLEKCAFSGTLYKKGKGGEEKLNFEEISSDIGDLIREKRYPNGSSDDNAICSMILDEFEEKLIKGFERELGEICAHRKGKPAEDAVQKKIQDYNKFVEEDLNLPQERKEDLRIELGISRVKAIMKSRE